MNETKLSSREKTAHQENRTETILAVDDNAANLGVISDHLKQCGYRVLVARDGESAIERAAYGKPDLILLDVLMPGMDGYETCQQLKAQASLAEIPVIFMTALSDTSDKLRAFQCGGVDYITKPFQREEMLARVKTHLIITKQRLDLKKSYEKLETTQQMKDDLAHMIVHDLRTPIWGLKGYCELLGESEPEMSDNGRSLIDQMIAVTSSLLEMVSSILDVNKMEAGAMNLCVSRFDLEETIRSVFGKLAALKGECRLELLPTNGSTPVLMTADQGLVERTVENLVGNAVKFTPEKGGEIRVGIEALPYLVRVSISDNGYGIPKEYRERIFEKFGQAESRRTLRKYSTGLGLPFCRLVVESHGGRIWLGEKEERGSVFHFELPRHAVINPTQAGSERRQTES